MCLLSIYKQEKNLSHFTVNCEEKRDFVDFLSKTRITSVILFGNVPEQNKKNVCDDRLWNHTTCDKIVLYYDFSFSLFWNDMPISMGFVYNEKSSTQCFRAYRSFKYKWERKYVGTRTELCCWSSMFHSEIIQMFEKYFQNFDFF